MQPGAAEQVRALLDGLNGAFTAGRVGIDVVDVDEVATSLREHGERYRHHLFTDAELADAGAADPLVTARHLAARFAAKEALFKVLQVGEQRPAWTEVEVVREPSGACSLALRGSAQELAESAGITSLALSMTHEGDVAAAVVFAICRRSIPSP